MILYEFYLHDKETGEASLVGVLPERRRNSDRITKESIIRWVRKTIGPGVDTRNIYFIPLEM